MKRFYKQVAVVEAADAGFGVALDGRRIRTVGGRAQTVPTRALAEAMAAEWAQQGETIDATAFILRDLADYAIDMVAQAPATVVGEIVPYAETDTLCYRAEPDEALGIRQRAVWDPLLARAAAEWGVTLQPVSGIIHRAQPPAALAALRTRVEALDAFALAALRNTTSLAASLVIGLLALEPGADLAALWAAASLEEIWQAELWGHDPEATARAEKREAAFGAAARFAALAQG